jgi:ubiquinone/menaquinone biosynthesis C-methylase UbiE
VTLKIILIAIGAIIFILIVIRIIRKLYQFPAPAYVGRVLDSDFRRFFQPPEAIIERSGIKAGMTVLELGCGSGAYTTYMARAVGEQGKLYAVDIQPAMLRQLEHKLIKAENKDIRNIELKEASAYELPFADGSIDLACMVTVLMEIPDRGRALREVERVLKPGGILAVTEFFPDPDYLLRATVIKIGEREGFVFDESQGSFWNYTVKFKKPLSGSGKD